MKTSVDNDSDDEPTLPIDTLQILQEFLKEKQEREEREQEGGKDVEFEENWQLSQFWYSTKTKADLKNICQKLLTGMDHIGLLSCPSLYNSIKSIHEHVKIFEYDKRFVKYGDDFVYYDFNESDNPTCLSNFEKIFDIVIVDPPFLSEECIEKISKIVKKVVKDNGKIIFCSGEVVEPWVTKYLGLKKCNYRPEHERNLGNEFVSYANFNLDDYL